MMNFRSNVAACAGRMPYLWLIAASLGLMRPGVAQAPTAHISLNPAGFNVGGSVQVPKTWTASALRRSFAGQVTTITYSLKGQSHTAHAVPLMALLDDAKPSVNAHVKHGILQAIVTITGQDGYTVVFSMGELLPEFGHEAVWVALDEDGKPLAPDYGPVEIIVPGDTRGARWVHTVATIAVSVP